MILSNDEIMVINQTAEFDSAIGYARAIEAKVLEKLENKLRDAERYAWITNGPWIGEKFNKAYRIWDGSDGKQGFDKAIDAAINESK